MEEELEEEQAAAESAIEKQRKTQQSADSLNADLTSARANQNRLEQANQALERQVSSSNVLERLFCAGYQLC